VSAEAEPPRTEAVRYWWARANESLGAAQRDLEAGSEELAISCAYYALFYAASAALLEEGRAFKNHAAVRAAFNRDIIKPGRLSKDHADLYNQLFRDRLKGDYAAFEAFDEAYVEGPASRQQGVPAGYPPAAEITVAGDQAARRR
jgi:uncharacterized protein (UPF0332 family)